MYELFIYLNQMIIPFAGIVLVYVLVTFAAGYMLWKVLDLFWVLCNKIITLPYRIKVVMKWKTYSLYFNVNDEVMFMPTDLALQILHEKDSGKKVIDGKIMMQFHEFMYYFGSSNWLFPNPDELICKKNTMRITRKGIYN